MGGISYRVVGGLGLGGSAIPKGLAEVKSWDRKGDGRNWERQRSKENHIWGWVEVEWSGMEMEMEMKTETRDGWKSQQLARVTKQQAGLNYEAPL